MISGKLEEAAIKLVELPLCLLSYGADSVSRGSNDGDFRGSKTSKRILFIFKIGEP